MINHNPNDYRQVLRNNKEQPKCLKIYIKK